MKKLLSFILALVLIFSLSVSSFAATEITFPELKTGWSVSSSGSVSSPSGFTASWWYVLLNQLVPIKTALTSTTSGLRHDIASIYTDLVLGGTGSTKNNLASLVTNTGYLLEIKTNTSSANTNLTTIASRLAFAGTGIGELVHDILTNSNSIKSDLSSSKGLLGYIKDDVAHLEEVLADDDDKALKDDSKDNQLKAQEEFFGDGANSVSSDNLGSLSSLVSAFRSFLGDDIGLGNLDLAGWEEITSSDDPWQFFTDGDAVAESMGVTASAVSSPDFPDTPGGGGGGGGGSDDPSDPDTPANLLDVYGVTYGYALGTGRNDRGALTVNSSAMVTGYIPIFDDRVLYFYSDTIDFQSSLWGVFGYPEEGVTGADNVSYLAFSSSTLSNYLSYSDGLLVFTIPYGNIGLVWESRLFIRFVTPLSDDLIVTTVPLPDRSPSLLFAPSPLMASQALDIIGDTEVVTSYYEDNKNALWGWLN